MDMFEELGEILMEINKSGDKILKWWEEHKSEDILYTEEGKTLRESLHSMLRNHAEALLNLSAIEIKIFETWKKNHPEEWESLTEP